jgi:hypothetical protein
MVTRAAVAGVASFDNLTLDKAGAGYSLTATSAGLTPVTSAVFAVTPAAPAKLAFRLQPSAAVAGVAISPAVQVVVQDALGNTVTSGTTSVTLAFTSGTGTSGAVLGGTPTRAAVAGVASFADLTVDKAGTGYTLTATATSLTSATSAAFNIGVVGSLGTTQAVPSKAGTVNTLIPTFTPVTASGGTPPYTFALSGGALPTGLSFSTSTGAVSGTPATTLATTVLTVTVTDAATPAATSSKPFTLTVYGPLTTSAAVPSTTGAVNALIPTFTPVTASGGTAPVTFAVSPLASLTGIGLAFNTATGAVSGTPTGPLALTTFTVAATDNAGATSSKTFTLTVIVPTTLTNGVPVTGLSGASASDAYYRITVPDSQQLIVTTAGGTGDVDLYVRRGAPPKTSLYDCFTFKTSSDSARTCRVANFAAGDWYVMLHAFSAYSGVTLTATYSSLSTPTQVVVSAGDKQAAMASTALPTPPAVRVTNAFGTPLAGVGVTLPSPAVVERSRGAARQQTRVASRRLGAGRLARRPARIP